MHYAYAHSKIGQIHPLGYTLTSSDEVFTEALKKGESYVEHVRELSLDAVRWANQANERIGQKKMTIEELASLENEFSLYLRTMLRRISLVLMDLNKLNPPLRNSDVSPLLNKILEIRRTALHALEPLSVNLRDSLNSHVSLSLGAPNAPRFEPAP